MYVIKIIFLLFITSIINNGFATELKFNYKRITFKIHHSKEKIEYIDQYTQLSIIKNKCNGHVFDAANTVVSQYLIHPFSSENVTDFLKIQIDQKIYFENPQTTRARFFINFLDFIKEKKIEEDLNCSKR